MLQRFQLRLKVRTWRVSGKQLLKPYDTRLAQLFSPGLEKLSARKIEQAGKCAKQ
ncbi:hypothetical protein D3C81_1782410 [compost metagenome]